MDPRDQTPLSLKIIDPRFVSLSKDEQRAFVKRADWLTREQMQLMTSRPTEMRLRDYVSGAAPMESTDLETLTQWLDWAFEETLRSL